MLGHAGQPLERDAGVPRRWSSALAALADRGPNVVLKLSAIASSADPAWTVDSIRPWVLAAIEAFGAERCMLASNWPIDRLYGTYDRLIGAYRAIVAELRRGPSVAYCTARPTGLPRVRARQRGSVTYRRTCGGSVPAWVGAGDDVRR